MMETFTCDSCGASFPVSERREFCGELFCPACLEDETLLCSRCGSRIWPDDNAGTDDTPLCQDCYDRHYTCCERCGTLLPVSEVYSESD